MPRQIQSKLDIAIPKGVFVTVKSRNVTVKGKLGTLKRSFKHLAVDLKLSRDGKKLIGSVWFGNRRGLACLRTVISHINNMIVGVTRGFMRKMRLVYAHFPINVSIENNGKTVQIRNFLGERIVRSVEMLEGVTIERSADVKDQLILTGTSVERVATSAAQIHDKCLVRNKDIRKFLDGAYVSEKGFMHEE